VQVSELQVEFRWSSGGALLKFTWSPGMFKYRYAYLSMFQVDSRWTPENHLESSGVHLNSVGECKVLGDWAIDDGGDEENRM
jgi:hypothetical protein